MTRRRRIRRMQVIVFGVLVVAVAALLAWPTPTPAVRVSIVAGVIGVWAFTGFVFWRLWIARILFFAPVALALALAFAPVREPDFADVRQKYVASLLRYDGAPFREGGESAWGVDATGLVRKALLDTLFAEGLRTFNPTLLRGGLALWWHDGDADELVRMVQGKTVRLNEIQKVSDTRLQPGDLAVPEDQSLVLAYLGDGRWIVADPKAGKVATRPSAELTGAFTFLRWAKLAP